MMNRSISGKSDAAGVTLRSAEAVACEDSSGARAVEHGRVGARGFRPGALARLLVVKASCDLVFVLCLVGWFFFSAFDPRFAGEVEVKDGVLSGRVVGRSDSPITVQLFVDNRYVAGQDVRCAARIECQFEFALPRATSGEREARVYVGGEPAVGGMRRVQRMLGEPRRFVVE